MKVFSGVQGEILKAKKKNQLVSAGAGSGKTTVMIEKISNLILSGETEVDNLLVVTFTVLAAQEMKERLIAKLTSELDNVDETRKQEILKIIEKVDTASIDTIDGFSSKTIKKYFYNLEISPNIEIVSDSTKDYYLTKVMKKTFNEYSNVDDINLMLDLFGGNRRNLQALAEMIMNSYHNIINIENYEDFLDGCLSEYNDSLKSEQVLNLHIYQLGEKIKEAIRNEYSYLTKSVQLKLQQVIDVVKEFNPHISFKTNLKNLNKIESVRFSVSEYKENENLKNITKQISEIVELKNDLEKNEINEKYEEKNEKIIKYLKIFINLLKKFIKNYNNIKEKNNLIDFNDLNRLMLKLLKNETVKHELQEKYKYIFIDEYQDVNPLQDKLMKELTGENTTVFMVGDVKQSIYGFRGSSPEWFLDKYNNMKNHRIQEDVFDMNINFRSSPTILNFINQIFSILMTKQVADIDYKNDCIIEPKRDDIIDDKVKILLVEEEKFEEIDSGIYSVKNHRDKVMLSAKDKECMLVLKTITELVGTEFYDANKKETRKLTYSDIAILTHSDKDENATLLIDVLRRHAVPLNINNKLVVDESETIKLILSILKCVINTADDVDYLATFLSLTDLTIDDVVRIRDKNFSFYENLRIIQENLIKNDDFLKISQGFETLNDIYEASCAKTNKELISYILNDKKLKYYILQKPNGEKELNLIDEFMQKISPLEDSLGIAEFIDLIESSVDSKQDFLSTDKEDSVTIQTIHKSKGLEYPVVILFNSSKMFSYLREKDAITFNANLGFGVDYFDTANRVKMDSLTKYAIKLLNNSKGYKEELRLLYVALTRAKNKLIITGTITNKKFQEIKKTSYTNMLLSCFAENIVDDRFENETCVLEILSDGILDFDYNDELDQIKVEDKSKGFEYSNKELCNIPLKNTVTGINTKFVQDKGYNVKEVVNLTTQYNIEDRAKVGTEYHSALEMLDFTTDYVKNSDFESVDYQKIELAHKKIKPLFEGSISHRKEAEFVMYVPYNEVVASNIEDKILIQGIVDLLIEKENSVILVDYKFSSLPAKVLKEKYMEQLKLYKLAIENAYNKKVEHMFIYSINTGELI